MKKIVKILDRSKKHWVGDGFHVHGIIRPTPDIYPHTNPFILMDYAAPKYFEATDQKRGVSVHPHKGFETVTFALQGEVEHRDSSGGGGVIKQGDVQWMTAGKGVLHDEFHSEAFKKKGGIFEMIQLWVNLPKKNKLTDPKYQNLKSQDFKIISDHGLSLKLIAGKYGKFSGPASTFSDMNIYQIELDESSSVELKFEEQTNTMLLVLTGRVEVDSQFISASNIALFTKDGTMIEVVAREKSKLLVLNAKPIEEPIYAHGPFVMNTQDEIKTAIDEYQRGAWGQLD